MSPKASTEVAIVEATEVLPRRSIYPIVTFGPEYYTLDSRWFLVPKNLPVWVLGREGACLCMWTWCALLHVGVGVGLRFRYFPKGHVTKQIYCGLNVVPHITTLGPVYILFGYMDPFGFGGLRN